MTAPLTWSIHGNDRLSEVLEKLDANLGKLSRKLDQVGTDAQQMGRHVADVQAPTRRLAGEADHASGRVHALGDKMAGVAARAGQLAAGIAAFAAVGAGALAAIGLKTAASNEQAMVSFTVLLGSGKKAKDFLEQLEAFAARTPFEFPELRTAASKLLAAGFAAKDVIPFMTRLGDATSAMGTGSEGIGRAVYALQQMRSAGRVTLEDLNQLTDAGIPALDAIAAKLGTTQAKVRDMVSAGKLSPDTVFSAILEGKGKLADFSGLMDEQSKTFLGKLSNLKDTANKTLGKFFGPSLDAMKPALDALTANIDPVFAKLREMGKRVGDIFKDSDVPSRLMTSLRELGEKVLPTLREAWDRVVGTLERNKEGLEKLGRFITDFVVPALGSVLVVSIDAVARTLQVVIEVSARVVDAIKFMTQMFLANMKLILDASVMTYGWVPILGDKLREAQAKFDTFAGNVMSKLNGLDGKTVDVYVRANLLGSFAAAAGSGTGRASGGPVWPGQVYTWQEQGREGLMLSGGSGTVVNSQDMRSAQSGSDVIVGTLRVVHETPSGTVIREELLQLKRQRGLPRLGFEA